MMSPTELHYVCIHVHWVLQACSNIAFFYIHLKLEPLKIVLVHAQFSLTSTPRLHGIWLGKQHIVKRMHESSIIIIIACLMW